MREDEVTQQKVEEHETAVPPRKGVPQGKKLQGLTLLGRYLEAFKHIFGVTHARVAKQSGVGGSTLSQIMHGDVQPERGTVLALWQGLQEIAHEHKEDDLMTPVLENAFYNATYYGTDYQYELSETVLLALEGRAQNATKMKQALQQRDQIIEALREELQDLQAENIILREQLRP